MYCILELEVLSAHPRTKLQQKRANKESITDIDLVMEDAFDNMQAYYQVGPFQEHTLFFT
jgi:hypothetical protein